MRGRKPKLFTYTGTAAALAVYLGFRPVAILFLNETDGDVHSFFLDNMTADKAAILDTEASQIASGGITFTDVGFKVSTDAQLNESAKVYKGVAF